MRSTCPKNRRIAQSSNNARAPRPKPLPFPNRTTAMNILRNAKNWMAYRRTYNELSRMSDHELFDIGLNRGDINTIASRSFKR